MESNFKFTARYKIPLVILMAIGLVAIAVALFVEHDHGTRFWSNFLLNNIYSLFIALCGMVFLAIHTLGMSGWQATIQRIPEAIMMYIPVGSVLMMIIVIGLWFDAHHLYHWVHPEPDDVVLISKKAYLNVPFFSARTVVYLLAWSLLIYWWRNNSLAFDADGDLARFKRMMTIAGVFIVVFAVTSSMSAWDWLMSIDPHWFSTLYGWYVFSGLLVSGIAVIILLTLLLRRAGYLPQVNAEHLHDLGKYLFAFSVLWTYLWFSQYMLIWYSNIPEETIYFVQRLEQYNTLFFVNVGVNFLFPFLALMTRNSKRIPIVLVVVSLVALAGHWIDYFLMVMPGIVGDGASIGFVEIGMSLGYAGLFLFVVFRALGKANIIPVNHPYLKESYEYHTQY